jgi:hypothetical protein
MNRMALCLQVRGYLGLRLLFLKCLIFQAKQALLLDTKEYTQHANSNYYPICRANRHGSHPDGSER